MDKRVESEQAVQTMEIEVLRYRPEQESEPVAQTFLGFSRFPAARSFVDRTTGETTVRWTDMRFVTGLTIDQRVRSGMFGVTARLDSEGRVVASKSERLTLAPPAGRPPRAYASMGLQE